MRRAETVLLLGGVELLVRNAVASDARRSEERRVGKEWRTRGLENTEKR